jgi:hypothetical protein
VLVELLFNICKVQLQAVLFATCVIVAVAAMSSRKKKTPRSLGKPFRGKGKPLVPKWKLFRANEPLLSVFMWGVNHSVSERRPVNN